MNRFIVFALVATLSVSFLGCSSNTEPDDNGPSNDDARVRLLHFVYDEDGLDLYVGGEKVVTNTTYGNSSGYKAVQPGLNVPVAVHRTGESEIAKSSNEEIADGMAHTVYAFPPTAAFAAAFRTDAIETSVDRCRIKLANASYSVNPPREDYELFITGKLGRVLGPVGRTQVTGYTDQFAGMFAFTLKLQQDPDFVLNFKPVELFGATAYTMVIYGTRDESDEYPFGVRLFTDTGGGTEYIDLEVLPNVADVMFANAIWGAGKVDLQVDGQDLADVQYGGSSNYLTIASGAHQFSAANSTVAYFRDQSFSIETNTSSTIFMVGTDTPLEVSTIQLQDRTEGNPTQALVRFLNLAPDAGPVSVTTPLGGPEDYKIPGMQGLNYKQVSQSQSNPGENFLNLPPGTYQLNFYHDDADSVYRTSFDVGFEAGKIYSMFYSGTVADNSLKAHFIEHKK